MTKIKMFQENCSCCSIKGLIQEFKPDITGINGLFLCYIPNTNDCEIRSEMNYTIIPKELFQKEK